MIWILLGTGLVIFIYFALVKPFNYWKERGVPQYPFWITLRETLLSFVQYRSISEAIKHLYDEFPGNRYSGIYQFYKPVLVLRDPELLKQITVKDFDHFVDHQQIYPDDAEQYWQKNLFSLKGDKWRDMRATLSPSFTGSKMKIMFGLISECAKQFALYFEEQNVEVIILEMKDAFTRFTNDVIASSAFGVTCNSMRDRDNEFYSMGKQFTTYGGFWQTLKLIFLIMAPRLTKILRIKVSNDKLNLFFKKLVKDSIEIREKDGIIRPDMIHLLMEARKERIKDEETCDDAPDAEFAITKDVSSIKEQKRQKSQLTDDDIAAQALIFFFAGFDSVSTLMCFMAYELAINPDIQSRLQVEVDDTLDECGGSLTYEALSKMKYMDMVVSESLRKWPAAVATDRVCTETYTVPPHQKGEKPVILAKGDVVLIPVFGIHRDPQFYPEPERFDPERFSDENKSSITPYTFTPFGSGPRSCIANRFALMETKLVFFHLLRKFDITVVEKTTIPLKLSKKQYQLTADGGFWLGLKSRNM